MTRSVSKEKVVTSRRVSTTRKFFNFSWARENAGRTRSSPRRPSVPCRRRPSRPSAKWTMLQHWHAQQRASISARQRRFFGVVGVQNGGMRAMVTWMPGPPPTLRLTFQSARLADDVSDARPAHDIDGVSAITLAILALTTVCASTTSCSPSCLLAASRRLFALTAQRLEHSFISSLRQKAQMLSRIVSVRYSPLTTVSRGCPCATASRPSHLSNARRLTRPLRPSKPRPRDRIAKRTGASRCSSSPCSR